MSSASLSTFCLVLITVAVSAYETVNDRPVVGILSQEYDDGLQPVAPNNTISYIAASYVKYVEGAGARVVPIRINQPDSYYQDIFQSINGLLIPGGAVSIEDSGYSRAGSLLYDLAIEANNGGDFFPIWGTCLGFEFLSYVSAGNKNLLTACNSNDRALPLNFKRDAFSSKLYRNMPAEIAGTLSDENSTSNFHHWCLTEPKFNSSTLPNFYKILSTNEDDKGLQFISSMEAINYPIWATQFHPEKNIYEWGYKSIPHTTHAVHAGQYFADFFINQVRKSWHAFPSATEETKHLIYNYQPIYTGDVSKSFLQCYFFD